MNKDFLDKVITAHHTYNQCPQNDEIARFFNDLLGLLFPTFSSQRVTSVHKLHLGLDQLKLVLKDFLVRQGQSHDDQSEEFFNRLPEVYDLLQLDVQAILEGDPAAKNREEVIRSYPGFYAISAYRIAHLLKKLDVDILPRTITEVAHSKTGIDIHPGAEIGNHFCIDHGTGVVIGETTVIGNHAKIYQGVTLGGLSVDKKFANTKRHPTIEDGVVIYAGATILGGETVVGAGSIIGGNVWLTRSVPANSKVYYQTQLVTNGEVSGDELVVIKEATS